jgi:peptidoglycan-associated lipoprotein
MKNPGVKIALEGHCDERGSDEYNLALGERRALAIKNYLAQNGVASEHFSIISYGEEKPVRVGHDEAAWQLNRRVEFK